MQMEKSRCSLPFFSLTRWLSGSRIALALGLALSGGCARYHPRPLNAPLLEDQYRSRTLNDPKLRSFVESNMGAPIPSWPPQAFDLRALSLIGYYYSPELEIARSQLVIAEAGIRVA